MKTITNTLLYNEYLKHLKERGVGNYYTRQVECSLGPFVDAFPNSISLISTADIGAYLRRLQTEKAEQGNKKSPRTCNNVRNAIISYLKFARDKGWLPKGIRHPASMTTAEEDSLDLLRPNDIDSVPEIRKISAAAEEQEPELLPTLEIRAFSGIWTEEIVRLWSAMVSEAEELIRVQQAIAKTPGRLVPIPPNLRQLLAKLPAEIKRGRVAARWGSAASLCHAWQRICRKAGVPHRRKAFRNSYFSYRLAIVGDVNMVAEEGGTSAGLLKQHYLSRAAISRPTAKEWFSL